MNFEADRELLEARAPMHRIGRETSPNYFLVDPTQVATSYEHQQANATEAMRFVTSRDLEILREYCPPEKLAGRSVLEVGIGPYGRTSRGFLNNGVSRYYGNDIQPVFIESSRLSLAQQILTGGTQVEFICGEIDQAEVLKQWQEILKDPVDIITMWGGPLNYMGNPEMALRNARELLTDNGKLALHFVAPYGKCYQYTVEDLGYRPGYASRHIPNDESTRTGTVSGMTVLPSGDQIPAKFFTSEKLENLLTTTRFTWSHGSIRGIGELPLLLPADLTDREALEKFTRKFLPLYQGETTAAAILEHVTNLEKNAQQPLDNCVYYTYLCQKI